MNKRFVNRGLLLMTGLAFIGAFLFLGRWAGAQNFYSFMTAITIVALWFKVARLTKLLREHGIDINARREEKCNEAQQRRCDIIAGASGSENQ